MHALGCDFPLPLADCYQGFSGCSAIDPIHKQAARKNMNHKLLAITLTCGMAGATAGLALQPAWATSCLCLGESMTLVPPDGLDTCSADETDCTGRWREDASLAQTTHPGLSLVVYGDDAMTLEGPQ